MASYGGRLTSNIMLRSCCRSPLLIRNYLFSNSFRAFSRLSLCKKSSNLSNISSRIFRRRFHSDHSIFYWHYRTFCCNAADSSGDTGTTKPDSTSDKTSSQPKTKKPPDRMVRVTPAPKHAPPTSSDQKQASPTVSQSATKESTSIGAKPKAEPYLFSQTKLLGPAKAKSEYCLNDEHLKDLPTVMRRSPYIGEPPCKMYRHADVLAKALAVHGSIDALEKARTRAKMLEFVSDLDSGERSMTADSIFSLFTPSFSTGDTKEKSDCGKEEKSSTDKGKGIASAAWRSQGTERVVLAAVAVNATSLVVKLVAWWYTGSHSLMAESLHSMADTMNQLLIAYGVHQSLRKPDKMHPYGYSNVRYVTSLVSGIGIFYIGSAMSLYHGLRGLWATASLESLPVGLFVLAIAFCGDGVTFLMARRTVMSRAAANGMSVSQYVRHGEDPSLSVVYLEDRAALYGVGIAIASISLSYYFNTPIPDSLGSICIGLVLFQVAYKIIAMNVDQLLGKSIPLREIEQITRSLEADPVVRSIQDIKATELGAGQVRFKAEIDFDGRNITGAYLKTIDLQKVLEEAQSLKTQEDLAQFLMKHGEQITDRQGAEIDRIEQALKKKFPDLRHVDLEAL